MTYFANFSANNGTHFAKPITGTNKRVLCRQIRQIAASERFSGNEAAFDVWHMNEFGHPVCDYHGGILTNGQIWYCREMEGRVL